MDAHRALSGDLPLSPEDETAYRVVIGLSAVTPEQLAEASGGDLATAERSLQRLRSLGLVSPRAHDDPRFEALAPDMALATTLLRRQESLDAARSLVAALTDAYRAATRRRDPRAVVEIVTGPVAIRETLRALQDGAREEILWFCRANPLAMPGADNHEERRALERGVRYRAVYERELVETDGELDGIIEAIGWGEEARVTPVLPVRLAIIDRATAVCPLLPDAERGVAEPTAAVIGPGQLLDALLALFDGYWSRATPLGAAPADRGETRSPDGVSDADRTLLSLVVAGLGDKMISARLNISRRTVQRRLLRLMSLADVDTRPALAFQAARRGWL